MARIEVTHWSKKGSKMITSSPGSMKPMNALSIPWTTRQLPVTHATEYVPPSFAPVVMVTSVSGLRVRPKEGE